MCVCFVVVILSYFLTVILTDLDLMKRGALLIFSWANRVFPKQCDSLSSHYSFFLRAGVSSIDELPLVCVYLLKVKRLLSFRETR